MAQNPSGLLRSKRASLQGKAEMSEGQKLLNDSCDNRRGLKQGEFSSKMLGNHNEIIRKIS
jgi:hypothetical protein